MPDTDVGTPSYRILFQYYSNKSRPASRTFATRAPSPSTTSPKDIRHGRAVFSSSRTLARATTATSPSGTRRGPTLTTCNANAHRCISIMHARARAHTHTHTHMHTTRTHAHASGIFAGVIRRNRDETSVFRTETDGLGWQARAGVRSLSFCVFVFVSLFLSLSLCFCSFSFFLHSLPPATLYTCKGCTRM